MMKAKAFQSSLSTAIICIGLLLGGCSSDSPVVVVPSPHAGEYVLRSVNGNALPYQIFHSGADNIFLTSDIVTLTAGGAFTEVYVERTTQAGVVTNDTTTIKGTYTVSGTAVTIAFTSQGGGYTGTIAGQTLTLAIRGDLSFLFDKR